MRLTLSRFSSRRRLALVGVGVVALAGLVAIPALSANAAVACNVTYKITSQWGGQFQGDITIQNPGDAWTSWSLSYNYANGQRIGQNWSSRLVAAGPTPVTIANEAWNGNVATGGSVSFGFIASWSGTNSSPTAFTVNGVACNGGPQPTTAATTAPTSRATTGPTSRATTPPTSRATTPPTSRVTTPVTTGPVGPKANNPYAGGTGYVNPEWRAKVQAEAGGSRIANTPTAVWLDRIAAIEGTSGSQSNGPMGLEDHLDAAVAQGAAYIQIVIYNLPGRDCAALASNGELGPNDLPRYQAEYIDPIAAIQGLPKFRNLRIINIIEIDSLPNLITNVSGAAGTPECAAMQQNGGYVQGVGYAVNKLGALPNVYNYIDAAHHGWIGWDSNFGPTAQILKAAATANGSTVAKVHGFIVNTANYSALVEPYFTINSTVNGQSVRQSAWVDWNFYVDELSFAQAFRTRLVSEGFDANIGMLIDTSRNGWGGSARPSGASTSTDMNTFVNGSRIDRRIHAGNWCNQSGAGLGERPRAAPASGIDAYVWVKPPGESDGSSSLIPNSDGKGFDRMCDPTYTGNARNGNQMSGALGNAPISGAWFSAQIQQLMQNAFPAL